MNKRKLIHPFPLEFFREEQPAPNLLCFAPAVALWQKLDATLRGYDGGVGGEWPQLPLVSIFFFVHLVSFLFFPMRAAWWLKMMKKLARNRVVVSMIILCICMETICRYMQ